MTSLNPKYYIYYQDKKNRTGLMVFKSKEQMNLWLLLHGTKQQYIHVISGFTLEERKIK